jgi:hypothetical protein
VAHTVAKDGLVFFDQFLEYDIASLAVRFKLDHKYGRSRVSIIYPAVVCLDTLGYGPEVELLYVLFAIEAYPVVIHYEPATMQPDIDFDALVAIAQGIE